MLVLLGYSLHFLYFSIQATSRLNRICPKITNNKVLLVIIEFLRPISTYLTGEL